MEKNKYNIPLYIEDYRIRKGNLIDHFTIDNLSYRIRSISDIEDEFVRFGIELFIYKNKK
jgi:hypothetical protein